MPSSSTTHEVTQGTTSTTEKSVSEATIAIGEDDGVVVRPATAETLGKIVDIGDRFVFKSNPDGQLTEEENELVALVVESFNDRGMGDFWQKRDADIEAALAHLDPETRSNQRALKPLFGDEYLTEEEVRRSVSQFAKEFGDAHVQLWKEGKIVPGGRNEYGEILWTAAFE